MRGKAAFANIEGLTQSVACSRGCIAYAGKTCSVS